MVSASAVRLRALGWTALIVAVAAIDIASTGMLLRSDVALAAAGAAPVVAFALAALARPQRSL